MTPASIATYPIGQACSSRWAGTMMFLEPETVITTERLTLMLFSLTNVAGLFTIRGDPEAMRFLD